MPSIQMNPKIAILTHAGLKFETVPYLLHPLVTLWQKQGIDVVILRGTKDCEPADAVFMHIDLTTTPADYVSFAQRYPVIINGGVRDISKRKISSHIIRRRDDYHGPVLVKTDRNFGGGMERHLARRKPLSRIGDSLRKRLPWTWRHYLKPSQYPVYPSPMNVPWAIWWNKNLVVEKFLPEREGRHYALRQWVFLGNHEVSQRVISSDPIVKACNVLQREKGIPIPDSLRRLRSAMGFDYGKFDFVMVDGEAILLDANRTPSFNIGSPSSEQMVLLENLAGGMPALLKRRDDLAAADDLDAHRDVT